MPYRLLGLVADPDQVGDICGKAFAQYAASGTDVTLVCASAGDALSAPLRDSARALGVRDLVLLDFRPEELTAAALEPVFADIMTSLQPHIVVAGGTSAAIKDAAVGALSRTRHAVGGSAALPAKLYFRLSVGRTGVGVTSAIAVGEGAAPELFRRVFPEPWLTGLIERDLFAGIPARPVLPDALPSAS
ncbi:MAG TPA: hypothetical protein VM674_06700 [Candidatus Acidoferrum sp.]|nr:hypothetical protein [Candidatus Acidoferrum sp.]